MRQGFYKTTIISKFIKYLLSYTPLPVYKLIFDNEEMVKGCLYTYKDKILKCTKSGRFVGMRGDSTVVEFLEVQEPLRVSNTEMMTTIVLDPTGTEVENKEEIPLSVTDNVVKVNIPKIAEFKIVDSFQPGEYKPGVTQKYTSNVNYYDPDTHRWLGDYLRYISNMYDLDLMPLYNCFTYKTTQSIQLQRGIGDNVIESPTTRNKTILIPIKSGRTYTIAIDCDFPVLMKSIFYNDVLVKDPTKQNYLSSYINESVIIHNNMQFSRPVTYTLATEQLQNDSINLFNYEKYLYLAIQLPANNNSSIVVLEGDYSDNGGNVISDITGLSENTTKELSKTMVSRISLLNNNDRQQHPFSDKLIQYLLRNTIDTREYIDENVASIEKKIGYYPKYQGQWDDNLRYILFNKYMSLKGRNELNYDDILGYVDSDIENAVRKGYIVND